MEIAVDTNLISEKFSLIEKMVEANQRCVIPCHAFLEVLANSDSSKVNDILSKLQKLVKAHKPIAFGTQWSIILKRELDKQISETPIDAEDSLMRELTSQPKISREDIFEKLDFSKGKKEFKDLDASLATRFNDIADNNLFEELKRFNGPVKSDGTWFTYFENCDARFDGNMVLQNRGRYRMAWTLESMFLFYGAGQMFSSEFKKRNPDPIWDCFKQSKRWGSHHDSVIVAESSYASEFWTADEALFKRCLFLYKRGVILVRPVKIG
jgi:hypothetical protein